MRITEIKPEYVDNVPALSDMKEGVERRENNMAVNVKQLRIGSHILVDGKRERVRGMDEDNGMIIRFPAEYVMANEVEPIPITAELLKELGFVNTSSTRRITYTKGSEYEDLWIEVRNLKDRWEVFVSDNNWDGRIVCRYLHEAELFLVLHNIELVKD